MDVKVGIMCFVGGYGIGLMVGLTARVLIELISGLVGVG